MKSYIITINGLAQSVEQTERCMQSADAHNMERPIVLDATTPYTLNQHCNDYGLPGTRVTGNAAVKSCYMSHARLWQECLRINEPILVLEDDSFFVQHFDPDSYLDKFDNALYVCRVNYNDHLLSIPGYLMPDSQYFDPDFKGITKYPMIQVHCTAGYIIKPHAAKILLDTSLIRPQAADGCFRHEYMHIDVLKPELVDWDQTVSVTCHMNRYFR